MFRAPGFILSIALSIALGGVPAHAHEFWLAPSIHDGTAGARWSVGGSVGAGFRGEAIRFDPARAVRFELHDGSRSATELLPVARPGDSTWFAGKLGDDRGALVVYQSNFASIVLEGPEFDSYLASEGLDSVRAARAASGMTLEPGRERYRRACKAWIAGPASNRKRATRAVGLPLEIVPEDVPGATDRFKFRLLREGKPLAGALVRAWRQPAGGAAADSVAPSAEVRTDARGRAEVRLTGSGRWLVSTVHMVAAADPAKADWESTWASFTFAR